MAADWITTRCTQEDGFPKVLYAATIRLGIPDRPEYVGREYIEHGTERCEVTVSLGASEKFLEIKPWSITATGFRLSDTYQLLARKALKYLCQMYEWHLGATPMRYFPPLDRTRPIWEARFRALERLGAQEDDLTVVAMAGYLLALDSLCDLLAQQVRSLIGRAEGAEARWRKARVDLASAEARAT